MKAGIAGSFNLCDVRDLADGIIKAIEKGRKGECYILANFDYSKAKEELGYKTRSYEETIHDEVMWYKQAGLI